MYKQKTPNLLAKNIKKARDGYAKGEVKRGTVDDLMKELFK